MEPTLVLVAFVLATQGATEASERASQAYLKQTKIDEALDRYQRKLVSEETRRIVGNVSLVAKVCIERRLTFEFKF